MGLRVNTNIPSLTALRLVSQTDKSLSRSLQRLATGLRINTAADDPSGLVISEQLRAQISSLKQASNNASNASNLISTAESALNEVNSLLISIRESAVYALNTGGASQEQIDAEQDSVDQALEAIDRVASTSRFATRNLLNGDSGFTVTAKSDEILDLNPVSMLFDPTSTTTDFSLIVGQNASQAVLEIASAPAGTTVAAAGGPVILRLTGDLGTEDITLFSGATVDDVTDAVNILRGNTGVYGSGGFFYSEEFGSDSTIRLEQVGGTGTFTGAGGLITAVGEFTSDDGVDAAATLNGSPVRAKGNSLRVVSSFFTGRMQLEPLSAIGTYTFTIERSGLLFQLSNQAVPRDQAIIGMPSVYATTLGRSVITTGGVARYGFLSTVTSGGTNDLNNDPGNAIRIVDVAIDQISNIRSFLGAFVNDNIEPAVRELSVHIENLTASESSIRDLDFAEETARLSKEQVLFQAGISVIAQTNAIPQAVIQLLQ